MAKAKRRNRSHWAKLVKEFEKRADQETQAAFAKRKRIHPGTFQNWVSKLRRERRDGERIRFVEVKAHRQSPDHRDVEIELGGGRYTARFASSADAARIADIVAELAGRLGC